jgi:signal transduction histidine kinase/ActR/RegA family two-component response regulator
MGYENPTKGPFALTKSKLAEALEDSVGFLLEDMHHLSLLRRVGELVGACQGIRECAAGLSQIAIDELPVSGAALLMATTGEDLEILAEANRWGPPNEDSVEGRDLEQRVQLGGNGDSVLLRAWQARSVMVEDLSEDHGTPVRFVGIPFFIRNRKKGVFCLWLISHRPVESRDFAFWELLSTQVSLLLEGVSLLEEERSWSHLLEERVRARTRELEQAHEELVQTRDQLIRSEKLKALGQMASGVAHDFNNILATILGHAQLYAPRANDAALRRCLEIIEQAAKDGAATVQRLQEVCGIQRVDAAPWELVDLNRLIQDVRDMTRPRWRDQAQGEGRTVNVHLELGEIPPVKARPVEIRDVLTNLIFNALDAMPQGGDIHISTAATGATVEVGVRDQGQGMDAETVARIFDPFFTTKGPMHSGLGLSTAYGLIRRHGGDILVESAPEQGTGFRVVLPAETEPSARVRTNPEPQDSGGDNGAPARILIIDDEQQVRDILSDILQAKGHRVHTAASGQKGLDIFDAEAFDMVITDLAMPEVSGWDVVEAVHRENSEVPIIMVTGWGMQIGQDEWQGRGVAQVLTKPFDVRTIQRVVAQTLGNRHAKDADLPPNTP